MTHCKLTRIAVIFACIYGHAANAAESIEYDQLPDGEFCPGIDLSRYSDGNPAMPGSYDVKVYVNESAATSMTVELIDTGKKSADACISRKMLNQLHIKQPDLKDGEAVLRKGEAEADDCLDLARAIHSQKSISILTIRSWISRFRRSGSSVIIRDISTRHYGKTASVPPCCPTV